MEINVCLDWLKVFLGPVVTVLGLYYGFKAWKRQKTIEASIWVGQQEEIAKIAACKAAWSLLAYMSEKENSKTVFVKRGDKLWYLRTEQGQEYFDALENVFFQGGHGLFLSAQTRDLLYSFRTMTRRVLDKQRDTEGSLEGIEQIKIENIELITEIQGIFTKLGEKLREELKNRPNYAQNATK